MSKQTSMQVPNHLGLILDGNRRWAKEKGMPTLKGHKQGYENLKDIVEAAIDSGVKYISAYIFSTENWNRTQEEVNYLMDLALWVAKNEVKELHKQGLRVRFLGTKDRLDKKLLDAIDKAEDLTKGNQKGTVALCFNYGGQQEIADAFNKMKTDEKYQQKTITPEDIEQNLYSPDVPPVDLVVRTSGEQRISGFMLWRASYAEMMFVDKYWPDFKPEDLKKVFEDYANRERRYGK